MVIILFLLALWFFMTSMNCVGRTFTYLFAGYSVSAIITAVGAAFWGWASYACMCAARDR